jgi:uncharacterized protein (DUF1015 family)
MQRDIGCPKFSLGDLNVRIKAFRALRPIPEKAKQVACPPYDVVNREEAAAFAAGNPDCYFHISRSEIDLPAEVDPHDERVYAKAAENMRKFRERGVLIQDREPALYVYRIRDGGHEQHGVMAVCHVEDYRTNRIRKHEKTRKAPEEDRTRHVAALRANSGPVLLTYRPEAAVDAAIMAAEQQTPLYDFSAFDRTQHTLWRVAEADPLIKAFADVPVFYIADGHHRAAAAARYADEERKRRPEAGPDAEPNWFMALICPANQMRILPYHRAVKDLNGMTTAEFLDAIREEFQVAETSDPVPKRSGEACMFLEGCWYHLAWDPPRTADPSKALDVSVLQERLLGPLLDIQDPRNDPRIEFVGGSRGVGELERKVRANEAAVAFSMYPTSIESLMAIADSGGTMPPKSTWFSPKPLSGLLIHIFDDE